MQFYKHCTAKTVYLRSENKCLMDEEIGIRQYTPYTIPFVMQKHPFLESKKIGRSHWQINITLSPPGASVKTAIPWVGKGSFSIRWGKSNKCLESKSKSSF